MADFVFDYSGVNGSLDEMKDAYKKMYNYSDDIRSVSGKLNGYLNASVITTLNNTADNSEEIAKNIKQLRDALEEIMKLYKTAEKNIKKTDIEKDGISHPECYDNALQSALMQALMGDYAEETTGWGVVLSVLVGLIPVVGQIADIRDLVANIQGMMKDGVQGEEVAGAIFSIIGLIPGADAFKYLDELGDLIKKSTKAVNWNAAADLLKKMGKKGMDVYSAIDKKLDDLLDSTTFTEMINELRHGMKECKEVTKEIQEELNEYISKGHKGGKIAVEKLEQFISDMYEKIMQDEFKEGLSTAGA